MIKKEVYDQLKSIKGENSFSDMIDSLFKSNVELRRKNLRSYFGSKTDKEIREIEKIISEVFRVAKGRLF